MNRLLGKARGAIPGTVWYAAGVLASTASTYILFLSFSLRADPEVLGIFALWAGVVAVVVQFMDGVSAQRIAQVHPKLSALSFGGAGSINFLNRSRFFAYIALSIVVVAVASTFGIELAVSAGVMVLGQGAYSSCVSTRVFASSPKSLLLLQLFNCSVFCLASLEVFLVPVEYDPPVLLLTSGLASLITSLPFLIRDFFDRGRLDLKVSAELRLLYLSDSWKHLRSLAGYQAVNACGTAVDTFLTALGGLRTAAEYQIVKRPMLALSSLNVAVGQQAISKYSRGPSLDWKKSLIAMLPVLLVWPILGFLGLILVRWITPPDYTVSLGGGLLLAASFALGAFLQITGVVVLVRLRTTALLVAAVVRIVVLVAMSFFTVPSLGVIGLGLSLLVANAVMLGLHAIVLISSDRAPEKAKVSAALERTI